MSYESASCRGETPRPARTPCDRRLYIQFHSPQIDAVVLRKAAYRIDLRCVAPDDVLHRRVNRVAGKCERFGGQPAEPGRCASDHNNVATHDELSRLSSGSLRINSLCINTTVDYPPADARTGSTKP
jgi:hypothetical protein